VDREEIVVRLGTIKLLPTFPLVVGEVMKVIENPQSSASDLARHLDPSMVSEVMRIANTAYYGTRSFRRISTLEHAIAVIGWDQLSTVVLQMPFLSLVGAADPRFDRKGFIAHSSLAGEIARAVSEAIRCGNAQELYVSGIMHDIGVIILYQFFREEWKRVMELVHKDGVRRLDAEVVVLGMDHGHLGALLLELWNVPRSVTTGIMFHHSVGDAGDYHDHVRIMALANSLAKRINVEADQTGFDEFVRTFRQNPWPVDETLEALRPSEEVKLCEVICDRVRDIRGLVQSASR
jgi:HD-like signal output (HDOD) protein